MQTFNSTATRQAFFPTLPLPFENAFLRISPTQTPELIPSPFNYTGSKFKLLAQILPFFPKNISIMIDLFCGGASVGINTQATQIILNDQSKELIAILQHFQKTPFDILLKDIKHIIQKFNLSDSKKFGYQFYQCHSAAGLSSYNKEGFSKLRTSYNLDKNPLKLFVLIIYAFNNQIRFNAQGEFNLPCGKRDFNANMQKKLKYFVKILQNKNIILKNKDFRNVDLTILNKQSFVYIDPPYLLATASYNENGAWNTQDENDLYAFMQKLHAKNIQFAFSNVIEHKGKTHSLLQNWLNQHPDFHVHFLNFSYQNCNYQTKKAPSCEILITNYGTK